jgi:hypothetical protein
MDTRNRKRAALRQAGYRLKGTGGGQENPILQETFIVVWL